MTHEGDRVVERPGRPRPSRLAGLHVPQGAGARRAPPPPAAARRPAPAPQRAPRARVVGRAARRPRRRSCSGRSTTVGPAAVGAYFGTAAVFDANLYWAGAHVPAAARLADQVHLGHGRRSVVSRRATADGGGRLALPQHRLRADDDDVASRHESGRLPQLPTCRRSRIPPRGSASSPGAARCGWSTPAAPRRRSSRRGTWRRGPAPTTRCSAFLIRELLRDGADREYLAAHATRVDELRARRRALRPGRRQPPSRASRQTTSRPARGGAAPRPPRSADRHRHLDGAGREPDAVVRGRAPRRHRLARAAGRGVVQPGLRPGARQAAGHPGPGPEPGPPSRPELPRQGGEYPSITMLDEMEAGNLQALFVLGGNVLSALPDARRVRAALERTPVVVVSDVQHGDMTEVATHVLAAAGPLERADLPHFSDCLAPVARGPVHAGGRAASAPTGKPGVVAARRARRAPRVLRSCPTACRSTSTTDDDLLRLRVRPSARATFDELKAAPTALVDEDRSLGWVERNILPGRALEPRAGAAARPARGRRRRRRRSC